MENATFAGGCFWRMQSIFSKVPGVISTVVGYAGGYTANPTYHQVLTGTTGHAESVQITFNPQIVSYGQLLQIFFASHDSSTPNRQGADVGTNYRSAIFVHSMKQWQEATSYIQQIQMSRMYPVVTQVVPFQGFYPAEAYHQFYEARQQQPMMMVY
jgi:peptide-methionine (S)-S-oxide reductase